MTLNDREFSRLLNESGYPGAQNPADFGPEPSRRKFSGKPFKVAVHNYQSDDIEYAEVTYNGEEVEVIKSRSNMQNVPDLIGKDLLALGMVDEEEVARQWSKMTDDNYMGQADYYMDQDDEF